MKTLRYFTCFVAAGGIVCGCGDVEQTEPHELGSVEQAATRLPPRSVQLTTFGTAYIDNGLQVTSTGQESQKVRIEQTYRAPAAQPCAIARYTLSGYVMCSPDAGSGHAVSLTTVAVSLRNNQHRVDTVACPANEVAGLIRLTVDYAQIVGATPDGIGTVADAILESAGPVGVQPRVTTVDMGAGRATLRAYRDHVETRFDANASGVELQLSPYVYCGDDYWWNEFIIDTAAGQYWEAQLDCSDFGVAPVRFGFALDQRAVE